MRYGDIIYDQPSSESSCEKLESVQYQNVLAITVAILVESMEKLFIELGLRSVKSKDGGDTYVACLK